MRGCPGKEAPGTRGPAAGEFALTVGLRWSPEGRCPEGRWRLCERRRRDGGALLTVSFENLGGSGTEAGAAGGQEQGGRCNGGVGCGCEGSLDLGASPGVGDQQIPRPTKPGFGDWGLASVTASRCLSVSSGAHPSHGLHGASFSLGNTACHTSTWWGFWSLGELLRPMAYLSTQLYLGLHYFCVYIHDVCFTRCLRGSASPRMQVSEAVALVSG